MNRYSTYEIKPPAVPIAFGKLLKVVAMVDLANVQTKELLAQIAAEGYEVEITDIFERDLT
jgi:ornithine decarboxylase